MKTMKMMGVLLSAMVILSMTTSFKPVESSASCNENRAKAAALANEAFKECAATHRVAGVAMYVASTPTTNGNCEYIVYAVDPFRCPPNQICPLVLIAPFSEIRVDENYEVIVVSCYPYIFP